MTYSGFESLGAHHSCRQVCTQNLVTGGVSGLQKLVSHGDVVEMGDTLVLETSAVARESSNLSIPTKDLWRRGRVV